MKLSHYAHKHCIGYRAAWNRYKAGKIPGAYQDEHGRVIIPEAVATGTVEVKAAIYARVSSSENKDNLESQAARLTQYAIARGWTVVSVVKEIGSGVNDHRPKLMKLLTEMSWNMLVIEHKDRLTRFGFNYLDVLLPIQNRRITVVNQAEDDKTDLVQDMVSIIYSFSARMYGQRRAKRRTEQLIKALETDIDPGV